MMSENDFSDLHYTQERKLRAYVMLKELLDLEKPIISNKMVFFLEQEGMRLDSYYLLIIKVYMNYY